MVECFHCLASAVVWDNDFTIEEWTGDDTRDGIVHVCHCANCGAEITYTIEENS